MDWLNHIWEKIDAAFLAEDRWMLYVKGLGVTMEVAVTAGIIGIILGTIVAFMKLSTTKRGKPTIFTHIANIYIDIIRGTPSVLQLLIMWFGVFASCKNGILVACLTFGINSGAYVAEIVRAGILAVDKGQTEAGRSLGLSSGMTMRLVVIPQAIKNIFPALCNEFITLIKETAIVGYVGLVDIQKAGDFIKSATYEAFMPLIGTAIIYFIIIKVLTLALGLYEKSLRKSEQR